MPRKADTWYLSVGDSVVFPVYRSLTDRLAFSRYAVCQALENARVACEVSGGTWTPVKVSIKKNHEVFGNSEDII